MNTVEKLVDSFTSTPVIAAACLAVLILFLKWYFTYRKLTYDPTWALRYQEKFDSMKDDRDLAAKTLLKYRGKLKDIEKYGKELENIDEVLDVISDIDFYTRGDQISPEVAYNHFYHWVRGYWIASRDYVSARQEKEPRIWDSIKPLFDTLCTIEVGIRKRAWEKELSMATDNTQEFLESEMKNPHRSRSHRRKKEDAYFGQQGG